MKKRYGKNNAAGVRIEKRVQAALSGKRVHYEKALPYKRAGRHWVAAIYVPDINEQGNTLGFYALVTDIDQRKQMEEALKTSEARMAMPCSPPEKSSWCPAGWLRCRME